MASYRRLLKLAAVCVFAALNFTIYSCTREDAAKDEPLPAGDFRYIGGIAPDAYPGAKASMGTLIGDGVYADSSALEETKTYLSGVDVKWNKGDEVTAFYASDAAQTATAGNENEDGQNARFFFPNVNYSVAYYPGDKAGSYDSTNKILSVTGGFPTSQAVTQNGFASGVNLMAADASGVKNWTFQNAGALVAFSLSHTGGDLVLSSIKLTDKSGSSDHFSGNAQLTFNGSGEISAVTTSAGNNYVSLDGDITLNSKAQEFYAVVAPGKYNSGSTAGGIEIELTRKSDGATATYRNNHALEVARNSNTLIADFIVDDGKFVGESLPVIWDASQNPTISGTNVSATTGSGSFFAYANGNRETTVSSGHFHSTLNMDTGNKAYVKFTANSLNIKSGEKFALTINDLSCNRTDTRKLVIGYDNTKVTVDNESAVENISLSGSGQDIIIQMTALKDISTLSIEVGIPAASKTDSGGQIWNFSKVTLDLPHPIISSVTTTAPGDEAKIDNDGANFKSLLSGTVAGAYLTTDNVTCGFEYGFSSSGVYTGNVTSVTKSSVSSGVSFTAYATGITAPLTQTVYYRAWASVDGGATKKYGDEETISPVTVSMTATVKATAETTVDIDVTNGKVTIGGYKGSVSVTGVEYYEGSTVVTAGTYTASDPTSSGFTFTANSTHGSGFDLPASGTSHKYYVRVKIQLGSSYATSVTTTTKYATASSEHTFPNKERYTNFNGEGGSGNGTNVYSFGTDMKYNIVGTTYAGPCKDTKDVYLYYDSVSGTSAATWNEVFHYTTNGYDGKEGLTGDSSVGTVWGKRTTVLTSNTIDIKRVCYGLKISPANVVTGVMGFEITSYDTLTLGYK